MEAEVLQTVGFCLLDPHSLYLRFCELQDRFKSRCPKRV
jgi:hypothetical protein